MEKGIVFGKGFLGQKLSSYLNYELSSLNVLDTFALQHYLDEQKPTIVVNAVGKTGRPNIDWCETHREETIQGNVVAALNLAIECKKRNIYFVHLGSGCIYQGYQDGRGYTEEDEPNGHFEQFYAKTKVWSEKILKELDCLQIRLRMPIDDVESDRNTINKVLKYTQVIDTKNSMTVVPDLLICVRELIAKRKTGVYNVVNEGLISPVEIMQLYQEIVDPTHSFEVINADVLDTLTRARRTNCMLNTDKLKKEGLVLPEIHASVRKCMESIRTARDSNS